MANNNQEMECAIEQQITTPNKYAVVLKNDDFTPMDFVVNILLNVFGQSESGAVEIMLEVHTKGRGVAGVYTKEIAETKVAIALNASRNAGHPFMCFIESV